MYTITVFKPFFFSQVVANLLIAKDNRFVSPSLTTLVAPSDWSCCLNGPMTHDIDTNLLASSAVIASVASTANCTNDLRQSVPLYERDLLS